MSSATTMRPRPPTTTRQRAPSLAEQLGRAIEALRSEDIEAAEPGGEQEQECEAQGDALTDGERAEAHSDRWLDVVTFCRLGKGVSVTTEVPEARIDGR